jgi:hypothetical protein
LSFKQKRRQSYYWCTAPQGEKIIIGRKENESGNTSTRQRMRTPTGKTSRKDQYYLPLVAPWRQRISSPSNGRGRTHSHKLCTFVPSEPSPHARLQVSFQPCVFETGRVPQKVTMDYWRRQPEERLGLWGRWAVDYCTDSGMLRVRGDEYPIVFQSASG